MQEIPPLIMNSGGSSNSGGGNSGNNSGGQGGLSDIIYNTGPIDISMVNKDVSTKQDVYATNLGVNMEAETINGYVNTSADTLRGEEITYINNNLDMNLNIDPKLFTQRGQKEAKQEIEQAIANMKESGQAIAKITINGVNVVVNGIQNMSKSDIERAVNTTSITVKYYQETGKVLSFEEQAKLQAQAQGITLSDEDIANAKIIMQNNNYDGVANNTDMSFNDYGLSLTNVSYNLQDIGNSLNGFGLLPFQVCSLLVY